MKLAADLHGDFAAHNIRPGALQHINVSLPRIHRPVSVVQNPDSEQWWHRAEGDQWEPETFQVLQAVVQPDSVVVDLGAWIGITPLFSAALGALTYAFEPDPAAFAELIWNVRANADLAQRISLHPMCISDKTGEVTMRGYPGDSGSSIMPGMYKGEGGSWQIQCTTFGDFLASQCIAPSDVSVIKVDIEGAEIMVLPEIAKWLASVEWPRPRGKPALWLSLHKFAWDGVDVDAFAAVVHKLQQDYAFTYDAILRPQKKDITVASQLLNMYLFTDTAIAAPKT